MKAISYFILSMILACGGESSTSNDASYSVGYEDAIMISEKSVPAQAEVISQDQKIIQTGNLRFETRDLEKTQQHIQKVAAQNQGFIQDDNSGKNYNEIYRNITLRVPTANFQSVIDSISKGVAFFDQKDISRQDVTEEFIDLEGFSLSNQQQEVAVNQIG
jgi:hypothetical protein